MGDRWGKFKYGDGTKYGTRAAQNTLTWGIEIDWDADGVFDGTNEAYYSRDMYLRRGREFYVRKDGEGFEEVNPGELTVYLDNSTKRFDPFNSGGDLYGYIRPGVAIKVRVVDDSTGTEYNVFYGYLTDIVPLGGQDDQVIIKAIDGIEILKGQNITDVLYADDDAATVLGYILTAASWGDGSSIEDIDDVIPYWWTESDTSAWEECWRLAEAFMGVCFVAADGTFKYYARQHSEASITTITSDEVLKEIPLPQPWEVVRNYIIVYALPRRAYAGEELWRLTDIPLIIAGDTLTVWATYSYGNEFLPADNVVTPVATTDYTMNAEEGGGGADLTGNFTVTATKYATTTKLEITNGGGTDGYVTLLKLRGDALSAQQATMCVKEDSDSQDTYGKRKLTIRQTSLQDSALASDFASFLKAILPDPLKFPRLYIEGRPGIQFACDLFDKVTLNITAKEITGDYDVAGIEMQWLSPTGQIARTTWFLEPALDDRYWILPAVVGSTTIVGF